MRSKKAVDSEKIEEMNLQANGQSGQNEQNGQNGENEEIEERTFSREDVYKNYESALKKKEEEAQKKQKNRKPGPLSKMSRKKRNITKAAIIVVALLVVIAVAAMFIPGIGGGAGGTVVSTGFAATADVQQIIDIKGTVEGSDKAEITSARDNAIKQIMVSQGDRVSAGQVLAVLDADDVVNNYKKAQLSLEDAKRTYESKKSLYEAGAVSKDDYLAAKNLYDEAALSVESYGGLDDVNIKSPIDGIVTRVNVTVGRNASDTNNNAPMFVVENLDALQMNVKISEYDISNIKEDQQVTVSAEVLGEQTVDGFVSKISPTGERKDTQTAEMVIPVTITIDKGDTNLIAGVTAKASILVAESKGTLAVPVDAVLENPETGEQSVFVVEDGILKQVTVETGVEGDFEIEVKSDGLKDGDEVVLAPTMEMTDGMAVTVAPAM